MSPGDDATPSDGTSGEHRLTGRLLRYGRRIRQHAGPERAGLLLFAKSTLAATVAWGIAVELLRARYPAFAPFSAALMLQVTVYKSVLQSTHFVLAVVIGVSLQGLLGLVLDPTVWTFALVAGAALLIGRWHRLGGQGHVVATSAFFAYSVFFTATQPIDRFGLLTQLVVLVVVGCAVGVAVNVLVVPPIRYRSGEYALMNVAGSVYTLLNDIASALRERSPDRDETDTWWRRAGGVEELASQGKDALASAQESARFNPRRLLVRRAPPLGGYRALLDELARMAQRVRSITDLLRRTPEEPDEAHQEFLRRYGEFLASVAGATQVLAGLRPGWLDRQAVRLAEHVDRAREIHDATTSSFSARPGESTLDARLYGGLLVETERLLAALDAASATLDHVSGRRRSE